MDIYYTTDGTAPTDFVFQDVAKLGGHRIVWDSPTSIRLEDYSRPVYFGRGTANLNVDGPRNYEIAPLRNARYYVYARRLQGNRWKPYFSVENTRYEPNSPTQLLLGYVISDSSGIFPPDAVINAVDAGDAVSVVTSFEDGVLNPDTPIALPSNKEQRLLRFFGKMPGGLFDPPQSVVYHFDSKAPTTTIKSTFTNQPYKKTLKVELECEVGSTIYWSDATKGPQVILFGMTQYLVDGAKSLKVQCTVPNLITPTETTMNLSFRKRVATGEMVTFTPVADLRSGAPVAIPAEANSFFDIMVVPDMDNPTRWRLEVGAANVIVQESIEVYVVARVYTDATGVLDPSSSQGSILNAVENTPTAKKARKTKKYVAPLLWNVTTSPYTVTLAYMAVDATGNVEATQIKVFEG
jgi:hypothetical protein